MWTQRNLTKSVFVQEAWDAVTLDMDKYTTTQVFVTLDRAGRVEVRTLYLQGTDAVIVARILKHMSTKTLRAGTRITIETADSKYEGSV